MNPIHNQRESEPDMVSNSAKEQAWQEIEPGRYQPRRIRGSCHGRELG
jgi:hypothetical protein